MRRVFAMLLAVFFAIFNNTPYRTSEKPMYNPSGNYIFADEDGFTAQELNAKSSGVNSNKTLSVAPKVDGAVEQAGLQSAKSGRQLTGTELSETKLTWTDEDIQKDKTIVMPEDGTVIDDSNKGNGGHDLTVQSGDYTFYFKNMQCRYSDAGKRQQKVWSDSDDLTGKKISAGHMIGIAKVGTTLEIKKDGKAITLDQYYK